MIDPRGHRFGAAVSALILAASWWLNAPIGVLAVLLSIGASAAFGMRWSVYGLVWRRLVKALRLGSTELEHEYPPRFAQTLGSIALTLSLIAFALGAPIFGWLFAGAVAALQTLLAVTGYCLGCRLYFLRWWVPALVTRVWSRGRGSVAAGTPGSIRLR
jgi:hypothetical protein